MQDPALDHSEIAVLCRACGATSIGVAGEPCGACAAPDSALVARTLQPMLEEHPLLGRVLEGKYAIVGLLGRGGFGAVYRAFQRPVGRPVAVKVMLGRHAENPDVRARFFREARAAAHLTHPAIVTLHDYGEAADGLLFMVLEYVAGENLARLLRRERPLEPVRAVGLMCQVLSALVAAHGHGIVHRDLKPYNLMVTRSFDGEQVKVLDFGMAKVLRNDGRAGPSDTSDEVLLAETREGMIIGSPTYMSPEQARAEEATPASDLYAVGVVLWEMLVGQVPFTTRNPKHPVDLLLKHINDPPPPMPAHLGIPAALEAAVRQAMAKRPEDRFLDARAMTSGLRAAVSPGGPAEAVPEPARAPAPGRVAPESWSPFAGSPGEPAPRVATRTAAADGMDRTARQDVPPGDGPNGDGSLGDVSPTIATPSSFSVDWLDSAATALSPVSGSRESLIEAQGEVGDAPTPARPATRWLMPVVLATAAAVAGSAGVFAVLSQAPEAPAIVFGSGTARDRTAAVAQASNAADVVELPASPTSVVSASPTSVVSASPISAVVAPPVALPKVAAGEAAAAIEAPRAKASSDESPAERSWHAALTAAIQGDGPAAVTLLKAAIAASPADARDALMARAKGTPAMQYTARRHADLARMLGLPVRSAPAAAERRPDSEKSAARARAPATAPSVDRPVSLPRIERK